MADTTNRSDDDEKPLDFISSTPNINVESPAVRLVDRLVSALSGAIFNNVSFILGSTIIGQGDPEPETRRRVKGARSDPAESLAEQRQRFYLDFLKQSLKQAEVTFWLSIAFMTAGAIVILVGAVLALVYAQSADLSYVPLVTALTGVLITVGGGALALHARRAKAHVTEQAERIGDKADKDEGLRTTLKLIDQVSDKDLRDRIRTAVALQALGVTADPETIASSLLADPKGEIESGDSKH